MSTAAEPHAAATGSTGAQKSLVALMLALTFSTGVIDATGYLGLDRVFTGNMTGNVVVLGMGIAGWDSLPVIGPLIAFGGFGLGAMAGGRVLRSVASGWHRQSTVVFLGVALLLAIIAVVAATDAHSPGITGQYLITAGLGVAMGAQAATARQIGVKDVTTVVVTSTLAGLAADSPLAGRVAQPWVRRALAVVLISLGALFGAVCVHVQLGIGPGISALITLVVATIGHRATLSGRAAASAVTA